MASEKLNVPEHVTIIMDGNGRWAKQRGQERLYGHKEGVESVRACTELAVAFTLLAGIVQLQAQPGNAAFFLGLIIP